MKSLTLWLILALSAAAEIRTWTDDQGRAIEGELIAAEGEMVTLRVNGRDVPWPFDKLSPADQAYVDSMRDKLIDDEPEPAEDGESLNFDEPWPDRVTFDGDPEIVVVTEDADEKRFVYESANYRYICDARLSKSVVKGFALLFEATHRFAKEMPLAMGEGRRAEGGKYEILLFAEFDDYVKAGGPPSSAGVFIGGRGVVMVPLTSLGVRTLGSGYTLDRDKSSKTLPHELIHQVTPGPYYRHGSRGWFSEGIAEYAAVTPYRSGSFNIRGNLRSIIDYATAYGREGNGGRGLGTDVEMPHLKEFMLQSYSQFTGNANFNYACGLLITTYFIHMDGEGDGARLKDFLKALRAGKEGEEALDVLLDGRTFEELQTEIAKAWSRRGIDFTFAGEGESDFPETDEY